MCESSYSAAVLQSGTRCVGVGLGAGVGGDAGAEGSRLCGMVELRGLVGVMIGRGAPERDILLGFLACAAGEENMALEDEADADAAMSVSESSICTCDWCWSSRGGAK